MFSLSLLIAAGTTQKAFSMNSDEQISHARWTGAKNGFYAGLFSGLSFGAITGFAGAVQTCKRFSNTEASIATYMFFGGLISLPVASSGKSAFSQKLKDTQPNLNKVNKKELKKEYHRAEFWANSLTTSVLATTAYAAAAATTTADNESTFGKTFCYALLPITAGVTAIKWMTYGICRNGDLATKNYNQKKQANNVSLRQQQRDQAQNDPRSS